MNPKLLATVALALTASTAHAQSLPLTLSTISAASSTFLGPGPVRPPGASGTGSAVPTTAATSSSAVDTSATSPPSSSLTSPSAPFTIFSTPTSLPTPSSVQTVSTTVPTASGRSGALALQTSGELLLATTAAGIVVLLFGYP